MAKKTLKTRRQTRYIKLRNSGFLPFEARPLSKIPPKICPYFKQLIMTRLAYVGAAKRAKATRKEYEAKIHELYENNGWFRMDKRGAPVADPWTMLRDYEGQWRDKQPDYTSPWEEGERNWSNFLAKIERTMKSQRGEFI